MVLVEVAALLFGLLVLIKGSDIFVEAAARIAKLMGISPFVIGLTLVAIGTSMPELITSIFAMLANSPELVVGNIVGSNISNIALILSIGVLVGGTLTASKKIFETDLFITLLVALLFFYFSLDRQISILEGIFMLSLFAAYIAYTFGLKPELKTMFDFSRYLKTVHHFSSIVLNLKLYKELIKQGISPATYASLVKEIPDPFEEEFGKRVEKEDRIKFIREFRDEIIKRLAKNIFLVLIGTIALWIGGQLTVEGAMGVAKYFNVSAGMIGFTIVAIGTSLPEFSVTITAARKGFQGIVLGNILGSNIANILLVIGISALIAPVYLLPSSTFPIIAMIISILLLMGAVYGDWEVKKHEAAILLLFYLFFLYGLFAGF